MKKKTFIVLSLILFFLTTNIDAQTTLILQPNAAQGKDAILHGLASEVNTNYGSNPQLPANTWTFSGIPGTIRSVIEFDLSSIPSGSTINSAYLSLYAWDSNTGMGQHLPLSGSNECWLQRVTSSWNENTVTWNTQPTTTSLNQVALPASVSPTQDYLNLDVSALVQDMIDNPTTSFGFLLRLQNESYYRRVNFASSDHYNSALHPKLVITYTQPVVIDTCIRLRPCAGEGKDATLHGLASEVNTNYGNDPQLPANAWTYSGIPGTIRSVIEFDLSSIPSGSTINSAYLSLYAWDSNTGQGQHSPLSGSNECWLQRVTSSWNENTVTWNTQPTTTSLNQVALPASVSPTQDYLNIDVSALVQDMIDNPTTSFGFLLRLQNESYYRRINFASSDHSNTTLHPAIEICYSTTSEATLNNRIILKEVDNTIEFTLYPNPAQDLLNIAIANPKSKSISIEVFNAQGQLVIKKILQAQLLNTIDVSNMTKGIYYVRIGNDNNTSTKKFLIE